MGDDKFQRWRKIAIDQLGYAINLILTFTVATLGYWFALLKDRDFCPTPWAKYEMILSLLALGLSAFGGFACVVNRLCDFRGTAKRAGGLSAAPTKENLRRLGRITWRLFYFQLLAFIFGVVLLTSSLLQTYGGKLRHP
jgi:hypothetical protein